LLLFDFTNFLGFLHILHLSLHEKLLFLQLSQIFEFEKLNS
jgi:hypothetical protein